jgi:UPF0716 protein FxsA
MIPLLVLLFVAIPLAELSVIVMVGHAIGFLPTFAALIAFSLLGAWLAKREGLASWRRLRSAMTAGRVPTAEAADGAMVLLAGALLLAPGFLTDAVGLLLMVPFVRAILRRRATAIARRRARRLSPVSGVMRGPRILEGRARPSTRARWGTAERPEFTDERSSTRPS